MTKDEAIALGIKAIRHATFRDDFLVVSLVST
jgi:20S proteasome alpha/beta subunit